MSGKFRGGIVAGSTSVSVPITLLASDTGDVKPAVAYTGVTAYYFRQGGSPVQISLSAGTPITAAYSSGKWFEVDAVNCPGLYRLDVPNAAFATAADWVELVITGTGIVSVEIQYNLDIANLDTSGNVTLKSGTHTGAVVPTVTTLTGHTPQTGDSYPVVTHVTYGNAQLVRSVTPDNALAVDASNAATVSGAAISLGSVERSAIADAVLSRSLGTEDYAIDNTVPTLAQALFMIISSLFEFSISGVTKTCKGLDGSTTKMTFTITLDSNSKPIGITRSS
jgi:hypothetical protein